MGSGRESQSNTNRIAVLWVVSSDSSLRLSSRTETISKLKMEPQMMDTCFLKHHGLYLSELVKNCNKDVRKKKIASSRVHFFYAQIIYFQMQHLLVEQCRKWWNCNTTKTERIGLYIHLNPTDVFTYLYFQKLNKIHSATFIYWPESYFN